MLPWRTLRDVEVNPLCCSVAWSRSSNLLLLTERRVGTVAFYDREPLVKKWITFFTNDELFIFVNKAFKID
jgi:hypothetical protein